MMQEDDRLTRAYPETIRWKKRSTSGDTAGVHRMLKITRAKSIGFCTGVRHAIDTATDAAAERNGIETLGALVHNKQVVQRLTILNINSINDISDIKGNTVVVSAHGVGPKVSEALKARGLSVIDTTCSYVKRAQKAARQLLDCGFFVVIFGDANHPEVKGILGWADGQGIATLDAKTLNSLPDIPKKLGILSQTTQIPSDFVLFAKHLIDMTMVKDAEIRLIDTICHETRRRQSETLKLAEGSDLMLVIGGRNSANTRRLFELCSSVTDTRWIETADELDTGWLKDKECVGVTAGTSTDDQTIDEIVDRLENAA
jgi:4-hydroxy-3-methylbut-2-enyl diphosphate reductase